MKKCFTLCHPVVKKKKRRKDRVLKSPQVCVCVCVLVCSNFFFFLILSAGVDAARFSK